MLSYGVSLLTKTRKDNIYPTGFWK